MPAEMVLFLGQIAIKLAAVLAKLVLSIPRSIAAADRLAERLHPVLVRMRRLAYQKQSELIAKQMKEHGLSVAVAPIRPYPMGATRDLVRRLSGVEVQRPSSREGVETPFRQEPPATVQEFRDLLLSGAKVHVNTAANEAVIDTANANIVRESNSGRNLDWQNIDDIEETFRGEAEYWEDMKEEYDSYLEKKSEERHRHNETYQKRQRERGRSGPTLGWARVLVGEVNCGFCAVLASRGPVYKSEKTAGFRAHTGCDCEAVLVVKGQPWQGDNEAALLQELWDDAYRNPNEYEEKRMEAGQLLTPMARFRSRYRAMGMTGESEKFKNGSIKAAEDRLEWMRTRKITKKKTQRAA